MAKNTAKIQFNADTRQFTDAIGKADSKMKELRAELTLNETQMKATGETVEGLQKKHDLLSDQLKVSHDKTEALSNKVDAAIRIYGEGSTEVDKWRTKLLNAQTAEEKLRQATEQCADKLKEHKNAADDAENATEELDESLENAGKSAEDASEGFTVLKGAMADLVADGIEAVVGGLSDVATEAFTMANDIDKATNTFIAKTGESSISAEEFEGVMTSIYNGNYGESFDDIAESMATVKTAMGDIGTDELEKLTTDALVLRDTFDMDVNESIRAVNSMMDQFGITADEAYSLIAQGAQSGLNQNGDLLDVVNEYSVQFQNAGYSAEDMFNMLANGVESGTWSVDKLGDAVKEFNIRMSDGSAKDAVEALGFSWEKVSAKWSEGGDSAKEVFNMMFSELDGLEDTTDGYSIGVGLLGTMYEDLGQDAVLALSDTNGEISTTKDALAEINAVKYDDLGSALEGVKRNLQTSIAEPFQNQVMPAVNEFIQDADWQGIGQTIGDVFGAVVEGAFAIVDATKQAVQWMQEHKGVMVAIATVVGILTAAITAYNVVQGVKAAMDAAQVTTIWGLVAAHWAQATAAMAALAPYILVVAAIAAVIAIIVLCIKYWDEIVAACAAAWEWIKQILEPVTTWIDTNIIQPVVAFFKNLWEQIKSVWNQVKPYFEIVGNAIKTVFSIVKDFLVARFQAAWEGIKLAWSVAVDWFKTCWENIKLIFSVVKTFFVGMFQTAWEGIKLVWSAVTGYFQAIWDTVAGIFSVVKSVLSGDFQGAWDAIKGIVNTWKNYFSGIWSGIQNVFSSVKTWFSNTFNSAWSAVKGIWSNCSTFFSNTVSKVKNVISKVKDIITQPFKTAIDKVKGFFDNLKLKFPNIKLPHFKIKGSFSLNPPSVPKLSIEWYKDGGIFTKPTIFNTPYGLKGVGEAGAEAVLPIDRLEGYISGAIEKHMGVVNLQSLADVIEDLANRPIAMNINGRQFALATAGDGDSVNGLRSTFKNRGLALD